MLQLKRSPVNAGKVERSGDDTGILPGTDGDDPLSAMALTLKKQGTAGGLDEGIFTMPLEPLHEALQPLYQSW